MVSSYVECTVASYVATIHYYYVVVRWCNPTCMLCIQHPEEEYVVVYYYIPSWGWYYVLLQSTLYHYILPCCGVL